MVIGGIDNIENADEEDEASGTQTIYTQLKFH